VTIWDSLAVCLHSIQGLYGDFSGRLRSGPGNRRADAEGGGAGISQYIGIGDRPLRGVVAGAQVSIKNAETGWIRQTVTDVAGRYLVLGLPVGRYAVTVKAQGFRGPMSRSEIQLTVGQEAKVDFGLTISGPESTIEVKGDVSVVNTTTADISGWSASSK